MRLAAYGAISTTLATATILAAFQQRPNFYSACVYLSQSNACLMILANMGVFLTLLFGFTVQKIFFGHLRAIEEAHLRERTWMAVTETFLAMTVFRDEFNTSFVVMFVSLLFVKCFHWICQDRIDYMEQFPTIPWMFHVRMVSAMLLFLGADIAFISYAIDVTIRHGANMMIMFGFEFILLAATMTSVIVKYILNVIDSRHQEAWENRSIYMFYLELTTDFFKLLTYMAFFSIILTYYGLPLHIIRDVYITLRSFAKKLMSFIRYRQATAHMNERYPDATVAELEATGDRTCIICREQMVHGGEPGRERTRPKKLRCGHILHFHCLRSWLERQQSCPTCRRPVLEETPAQPAPRNRVGMAPPPQGPAPIPVQLAPEGDPPPPLQPPLVPGPTPTSGARTLPRTVAGGPITLPHGYNLPPGWAVIPAHNVQIIPPPSAQNLAGVQLTPAVGQPGQSGVQQGSAPVPAGLAPGNNDVTTLIGSGDHVNPSSGQTAGRPDTSNSNTNIPPTPTTPLANAQTSTNPTTATTNTNIPNLMQRTAPRVWATHSPHPSFPIAVPLFPTTGNIGAAYRSAPFSVPHARTDGASTSNSPQANSPSANGVAVTSDERIDSDERLTILNQMGDSVRTMQDLVSKMSTLLPSQIQLSAPPTLSPQGQTSQLTPLSTASLNAVNAASGPDSKISNGHTPESPRSLPPLTIRKRSPGSRTNENEHHPSDRLRQLSSSEDELSPEELADIRAPWVEQDMDVELPLNEVRHSRQGSPPRMRSSSQSPIRPLRRRGSLLKHDITNEILEEPDRNKGDMSMNTDEDTEKRSVMDKGKGKAVYVEDEWEED